MESSNQANTHEGLALIKKLIAEIPLEIRAMIIARTIPLYYIIKNNEFDAFVEFIKVHKKYLSKLQYELEPEWKLKIDDKQHCIWEICATFGRFDMMKYLFANEIKCEYICMVAARLVYNQQKDIAIWYNQNIIMDYPMGKGWGCECDLWIEYNHPTYENQYRSCQCALTYALLQTVIPDKELYFDITIDYEFAIAHIILTNNYDLLVKCARNINLTDEMIIMLFTDNFNLGKKLFDDNDVWDNHLSTRNLTLLMVEIDAYEIADKFIRKYGKPRCIEGVFGLSLNTAKWLFKHNIPFPRTYLHNALYLIEPEIVLFLLNSGADLRFHQLRLILDGFKPPRSEEYLVENRDRINNMFSLLWEMRPNYLPVAQPIVEWLKLLMTK